MVRLSCVANHSEEYQNCPCNYSKCVCRIICGKTAGMKPVPSGMTAIGGDWHCASCPTLSRQERAHPTEPSPPQTRILKKGMLRKTYNLQVYIYRYKHLCTASSYTIKSLVQTHLEMDLFLHNSIVIKTASYPLFIQ